MGFPLQPKQWHTCHHLKGCGAGFTRDSYSLILNALSISRLASALSQSLAP